jgi:Glycosyltransferase family 87
MPVTDDIHAPSGRRPGSADRAPAPAGAAVEADGHAPSSAAPAGRRRVSARWWWLLVGVLVAGRIVAVPITLVQRAAQGNHKVLTGDIHRFHTIATDPRTPYKDFEVEYPPLMLGVIEAIDGGSINQATAETMWSQLVLDLAVAAILVWGWGRRAGVAYLIIGAPFIVYPFLYLRLDLLSVALAVGGLALVRRRRPGLGGTALALACFAKVWPVFILPTLLIRRSWRALAAFVSVGVVGVAAWVAWVGTKGVNQVVSMRGAIGWEIESTAGAILRTWSDEKIRLNRGAWRFGVIPHWANYTMTSLVIIGVVAAWWLASRRGRPDTAVLDGVAPIAAIGAFLVFAPLLSPQFLIWIVPFAAVAAARGDRLVGALTMAVVALSVLDLNLVWELVHTNQNLPQEVVLLRNFLLVVLLGVCFARLWRRARGAVAAVATPESVEAAA